MKKQQIKILLIILLNCQFLIGQEIDNNLFLRIEEIFFKKESVNLEFIFFVCPDEFTHPKNLLTMHTVLSYLQKNQYISLELKFHTDCQGKEDYNKRLSQRSAKNLKKWLVVRGVKENRIVPIGVGETKPFVKCKKCKCSELEHQKNRRLEISKIATN